MLKLRYLQGIKQRNSINSKIYGSQTKETGLTAEFGNNSAIDVIKLWDCLERVCRIMTGFMTEPPKQ